MISLIILMHISLPFLTAGHWQNVRPMIKNKDFYLILKKLLLMKTETDALASSNKFSLFHSAVLLFKEYRNKTHISLCLLY